MENINVKSFYVVLGLAVLSPIFALAQTATTAASTNDPRSISIQNTGSKQLIRRCDSPENAEYQANIKKKQQELTSVPNNQADTEHKRMLIINDIINQDKKQKCTYE
jgi:hypothetical protein